MRFQLIDRIESIEPGARIVTTKALSLAEEYLGDHFPIFPVLPGVLMLEALTESAAWLVRVQQDFSRSLVVLGSARNVRYGHFVAPGDVLRCEVDVLQIDESGGKFKAAGFVGDRQAVTGRIELQASNLADQSPSLADRDRELVSELRTRFRLIHGPDALAAAGSRA